MKRSEMLTALSRHLYEQGYMIHSENAADAVAKAILEIVEAAGMQPPPIESKSWNRTDNCYFDVNEWELE